MKFDDALLSQSARIVRDRQLARLPDPSECPEHIFSDDFEAKMEILLQKVRNDEIEEAIAPLGYRYYIRRSIAAVLIAFLLTFAAAPEAVMAGYKKIVETIKTIVTEYTEWHYFARDYEHNDFKKVSFSYLPSNFNKTEEKIFASKYFVNFTYEDIYFNLQQAFITKDVVAGYFLDTEDSAIKLKYFGDNEVKFIYNKGAYSYVWIQDNYLIKGQSNLTVDEIMIILENITFK